MGDIYSQICTNIILCCDSENCTQMVDNVFNGGFVGAKDEAVINVYKDDAIILDKDAFVYISLEKSYIKEIFSQMFVPIVPRLL
jgi:hypothetical protein